MSERRSQVCEAWVSQPHDHKFALAPSNCGYQQIAKAMTVVDEEKADHFEPTLRVEVKVKEASPWLTSCAFSSL